MVKVTDASGEALSMGEAKCAKSGHKIERAQLTLDDALDKIAALFANS
jgi:hypothetical protein